jgi:hypothetical protein
MVVHAQPCQPHAAAYIGSERSCLADIEIQISMSAIIISACDKGLLFKAKRIGNILCSKHFYRHSIHRLGVNAVMPDESTKHLAERPEFSIAACDNCRLA